MTGFGKFVAVLVLLVALGSGCDSDRPTGTDNSSQTGGAGQAAGGNNNAEGNGTNTPGSPCTPGSFLCDGTTVLSCGDDTTFTPLKICGAGTQCDSTVGDCVCAPACDGKACGDDGCGGSCGACDTGLACMPDGTCGAACPPNGTGTIVGTKVRQILWQDSENADIALHDSCGTHTAIMLIETAGWCGTCAAMAPTFKTWFKTYDPKGAAFIMDLGESPSGSAATVADAKAYKTKHNYPPGFHVVADPKWNKISQAVNHGSGTLPLPFFIVFDGEMNIRYIGGAAPVAEAELKAAINGEPPGALPEGFTCEGACGAQAKGGCYCDTECLQYGDCCPDACDLCGSCP